MRTQALDLVQRLRPSAGWLADLANLPATWARGGEAWPRALAGRRRMPDGSRSAPARDALVILASAIAGVVTAYLAMTGSWHLALGVAVALPAVIILHRFPLLSVIAWLVVGQFLMTTTSAAERNAYWIIHRALPPATLGIMAISHYLRIDKRRWPRLGLAELAMAGYVGVSLVSIVTLNDTPLATAYHLYDRVFSPLCLYVIVRLSPPGERELRWLERGAVIVVVAQSAIGLLAWIVPHALPSDWLGKAGERTTGSLVNPSTYSIVLIFAGLLVLQAAMNRKPGSGRTLYLGVFALSVLLDLLSLSRASWLAAALVVLGLMYLYPKAMIRLGLVGLPVLIILGGGIFSQQVSLAQERVSSAQSEESALSRLPVFLAAFRMFEAKPVFGWGYGNFNRYDDQFQGRVADLVNPDKDHASHNFYLTLIAEQGVTGFLLYLAPVIALLAQTLRSLRRMPSRGIWSRQRVLVLWLIVLNYVVITNFMNQLVVFGLGVWWITLALIAGVVYAHPLRSPNARTP